MTLKACIGFVVTWLFSVLVSQGQAWGAMLWLPLGIGWLFYCLEKDA